MMIARVRCGSPARTTASMIGKKKHSDFPDPVPVVTMKLSP